MRGDLDFAYGLAGVARFNTTYQKHIVTIEDPVELVHKDKLSVFSQREAGTDTESFGAALRAAIRQDADVILVGDAGPVPRWAKAKFEEMTEEEEGGCSTKTQNLADADHAPKGLRHVARGQSAEGAVTPGGTIPQPPKP